MEQSFPHCEESYEDVIKSRESISLQEATFHCCFPIAVHRDISSSVKLSELGESRVVEEGRLWGFSGRQ